MDTSKNHENKNRLKMFPNSTRLPLTQAVSKGPANQNAEIEVTLMLRRPSNPKVDTLIGEQVTHDQFEAMHSLHPDDLASTEKFAEDFGLTIKDVQWAAGTIKLVGPVQALNKAFGVQLDVFEHPEKTYYGYHGSLYIPEKMDGIIEAVLGLDNRPQARPHFQLLEERAQPDTNVQAFTPDQVAKLYDFPTDERSPQTPPCIGLIELGGGYRPEDLQAYFSSLGIIEPTMVDVSVDGAGNQPTGSLNGPDGEVLLDIEVVGAALPGCQIVVYFAPNTDAGFLNAIQKAIHDQTHHPSVLSISWGSAEASWTTPSMKAMDRAFQDAAKLGVTICCAAGDQGSSDGMNDGRVHVDFPASSPHVLACGGTELLASNNQREREVVWDEGPASSSGGGISEVFPLPQWQQSVQVPASANPGNKKGRGVPDVAGDADPKTGYRVFADGRSYTAGGTSAVAPLWASLIARINQHLGKKVGFINPILYSPEVLGTKAFHDITEGTNDSSLIPQAYQAKPGWDACTGLGTPNGTALLQAIKNILNS